MSSGNIPANIESIVSNLNDITWEQAIFEAVTNALQANADNIEIHFINSVLDYEDTAKYVDEIVIKDNGVGFHKENTESFKEYGSQYKRKKLKVSAKGIGRFLYLKIFEQIHIESLDKEISFSIEKDIDIINLEEKKYSETSVTFSKPRFEFVIDYENLERKIREHFIAYFQLLKERNINIFLYENNIKKVQIKSSEIPNFKKRKFELNGHIFLLEYIFNDEDIRGNEGYYCAGGRVVIKNSDLTTDKKLRAFDGIHILYLLSSVYLDDNVNSTRDNFTIMPVRKQQLNMLQNTSWKDIQEKLKEEIKIIAKNHNIDIDIIANESLKKSLQDAPFLAYYLTDNPEAYNSEKLIDEAKSKLEIDKKNIREQGEKLTSYDKLLSIVTQAELAEYMFDRQRIIDELKQLTNDNVLEKKIHDLFMKKYTKDEDQNYRSNNLWLFDDRFMTYNKVFSEAKIRDIFPDLSSIDRPDICIVSNTYDKEKITDIVLIELKRPDEKITPAEAQRELRNYADLVNQSRQDNKIRIWSYAFLKFNDNTERDLRLDDYNRIPTQSKYSIYYKYSQTTNTIINFLDYTSLAYDADTRHQTFMKILRGETL